jgi:replication factor C subunit 2/4
MSVKMQWIVKYRPRVIDDLVLDKILIKKLKNMLCDKNIPNIIITGVPGIGKTITVKCIANQLYGKFIKMGVLELNASDDRGIKTVQDIINFCKKTMILDKDKYAQTKLVIIDEADNMTPKAQQHINILMEKYHHSTRFIFTCNESYDILEAIQSRCVIFRYNRLENTQIINKLKFICDKENVKYDNKALNIIAYISQGDMRHAINSLQLYYNCFGEIESTSIYRIADRPHPMTIKKMLLKCSNKDLKGTIEDLRNLTNMGYSPSDLALEILNTLEYFSIPELSNMVKIKYMKLISETCMVISKGVVSELQLAGCMTKMMKIN